MLWHLGVLGLGSLAHAAESCVFGEKTGLQMLCFKPRTSAFLLLEQWSINS